MGFPIGYSDLLFPKLLLQVLSLLIFVRKIVSFVFRILGLRDFIESHADDPENFDDTVEFNELSPIMTGDIIPLVKYGELVVTCGRKLAEIQHRCAVCLCDFENQEQVRYLVNCKHIFHRSCLDKWVDHFRNTCPLCRAWVIPEGIQQVFHDSLWLSTDIHDFHVEDSSRIDSVSSL